ncbi:spike base protein, RCAP_Rcc01079 family [Halocynthiibacter sp.]|uniref:spike base protein, RCAP_Rcc01079 family n=1 Tax=Halocynthiibacter sp. TaxID=1979210 RepID=UPI003C487606
MTNPFEGRAPNLAGPARDMLPITPSDSADLASVCIGLYAEGAGSIVFTSETGEIRTINVPDFSIIPVAIRRLHATGTSATGLHGFSV